MADSTQFTIDLGVAGAAGVDSAANSVAELEKRLTAATSAASQAAEAVKSAEKSYSAAEGAYDRASKALEKINAAMANASGTQLDKLKARQTEAAAAADKARAALQGEAAALDKLKTSSNAAAATQEKLTKQIEAEKKAADAAEKASAASKGTGNLKKLGGALRDLGGPLGAAGNSAAQMGDTLEDLTETVGAAGPYVALAVAIVAIATAGALATAALAAWAIKGADAARSQMLLTQGIAGSVEGGKKLDAQIDDLSNRVPQTSEELRTMAADLAKTGLQGQALADALEDAATKQAKAKFGPQWEKQMISLTKLGSKLKSILDNLFKNLNIEPVLQGLASIVGLFDKGEASSNAFNAVWGDLVQGLVDGVANFLPKVRTAFIQFEIYAMKALIAIKPYGSTILFVVEAVAGLAAIIVGALVAALIIAVGLIAGAIAIGVKFTMVLSDLGIAVGTWIRSLGDISLVDLGTNLIMGLVNGIKAGAGAVIGAIGGVVTGAIDSAKNLLGIHSPSTVFAEIGENTGAGMARGVDGSTATVQGSLESMVSPPEAQPNTSAIGGGGSGASANLSGATFNFYGVEGAEDAESRFSALFTRLLEGDATQLGAAVAAAP